MKYVGIVCVTASVVFGSVMGTASAHEPGSEPEQLFSKLDKNNDGSITADEVGNDRKRFFDRLVRIGDKDDNGKLSRQEFLKAVNRKERDVRVPGGLNPRQGRGLNVKRMFEHLDRNGDGKLSRDEVPEPARDRLMPLFDRLNKDELTLEDIQKFRAKAGAAGNNRRGDKPAPERMFKHIDANGDGKVTVDEVPDHAAKHIRMMLRKAGKAEDAAISRKEFIAFVEEHRRRRRQGEGRENDRRGRGDRQRGGRGKHPHPPIMRMLDTNNDGKLSKEELSKAVEKFGQLDSNNDGSLDRSELFGPSPGRDHRPGMMDDRRPRRSKDSRRRRFDNDKDRPRRLGRRDRRGRGEESDHRRGPRRGRRDDDRRDDDRGASRDRGRGFDKKVARDRIRERFSYLDENKNGTIEFEEFERAFDRRGPGRKRRPERPDRDQPPQKPRDSEPRKPE